MNTEYKSIVESYYENLWNKQDKSYFQKLLHQDVRFRGSLDISTVGIKGFEEYFDMILSVFPNLHHSVELMVSENNNVAARAVYNGTHQGKLFDFKPTNNRIRYTGASFFKFKENKIIDIWVLGDLNSLYKQIS